MGLTRLSEIEMDADEMEYNEKLENISFIVSHKIRGPVATMLGLLGLIRMDVLRHDELFQVYLHLEKCVYELEVKCRELDELVSARNGYGLRSLTNSDGLAKTLNS